MDFGIVELSRLQFAMTALYHFLFVPLTIGLSVILAIMETVFVMTGRPIWRDMVKFWGTLFGINFVLGVATGLTMEFQFGMNWSYFSFYVGDVFGAPLAIEGLMAFFLEATFVGLFFFGWDRMSPRAHLISTWLVAIGSNLSALWILIANSWMQNPVGARLNPETLRMEITSFREVLFNQVAQDKFVHTVSAGYVTASVFVLGVSAWYMLKGRHIDLARRSMAVAAAFGLASALSVVVLGDESGYTATHNQKMKIAAIEGMWHTEEAPASFNLIGVPNQAARETQYAIKIPFLMGLITTRTLTKQVPGIVDLVDQAKLKIDKGLKAYEALKRIKETRDYASVPEGVKNQFNAFSRDLGYAYLLLRYTDDPLKATPEMIDKAAWDTAPNSLPLFWAFRIMVGLGFFFILLMAVFFVQSSRRRLGTQRWLLWVAVWSIPLPWIAAEMGWIVAEYGRQPWVIEGTLPTALAVSNLGIWQVLTTLVGFVVIYTVLLVIEMALMVRAIRKGPTEITTDKSLVYTGRHLANSRSAREGRVGQ